MDNATIWWIIGGIVVLAVLIWLISRSRAGRATQHREEATEIRHESAERERLMRERQASAQLSEAEHRQAQAEADAATARAEQLRVDHERRAEGADAARQDYDAQMRRADKIDPDVRTDREGHRLDERGNRIEDQDVPGRAPVDRDRDGDVGLDDRIENRTDEAIGHDDPRRNNLGEGIDNDPRRDRLGDGHGARRGDAGHGVGDDNRDLVTKAEDATGRDIDRDGRRG